MTNKEYVKLGEEFFEKGNYEEAIKSFKNAYNSDNTDICSIFDIGICYMENNNYKAAIDTFKTIPNSFDGYYVVIINMAQAYLELGQHSMALNVLKNNIDIIPKDLLETIKELIINLKSRENLINSILE